MIYVTLHSRKSVHLHEILTNICGMLLEKGSKDR